jgi:hypothetical protein
MTLNMGCGFWNKVYYPTDVEFNITQANLFVNEVDPILYLYEFGNFTIFPTYCDLYGYAPWDVIHETWNGTIKKAPERVIYPPGKCNEDHEGCFTFEVNTEFEGYVKFHV